MAGVSHFLGAIASIVARKRIYSLERYQDVQVGLLGGIFMAPKPPGLVYLAAVTTEQIIGLGVALAVMCVGLAGSVLPGVPSTPLILAAAIGHKLYFHQASVGGVVMALLVAATLFSLGMDYLASVLGAKKLGATWRGAVGAILGGLIGLFFAPFGLLLGPFLGAVTFEMTGGRNLHESGRAGLGAVLGLLAGALGKLACGLGMTALFTANVIWRGGG